MKSKKSQHRGLVVVAKNVSKDSWARCETPSMLYDAVRKPSASHQTSSVNSKGLNKDTIEITQRLKQEKINKSESKGLELPHESYVAVVQVGKYMFFAIMLPVYLCCYGVPRWFLANALPQLFEVAKNLSLNLGRFVIEKTKQVTDIMKGMLEQLIGDALRMSKQAGKNLWRHLSHNLKKISQKFSKVAKAINERLSEIKGATAKHSEKVYKKAEDHVKISNAWIKKKLSTGGKQIAARALTLLQVTDRVFLSPFMKVVVIPFNFLFYIIQIIKAFFAKILVKMKNQFKKIMDPVIALIHRITKRVLEKCKKTFEAMIRPIARWLKAMKAFLMVYFKKIQKAFIQPTIGFINRVLLKIKQFSNAVLTHLKKPLSIVMAACKKLNSSVQKLLQQYFQKNQKGSFSRFGRSLKEILSVLISGFMRALKACTGLVQKMVGIVLGFSNYCHKFLKIIFQKLVALPRKTIQFFTSSFKILAFITARVAFAGQVLVALIYMAFMSGFQLVKDVVQPYENALFLKNTSKES